MLSGDPSCPPNFRKAKQLTRNILGKTCAAVAEDYNELKEGHDFVVEDSVHTSKNAYKI